MLHFLYGSGFLERMIIIHILKSTEIYESNRFVSHLPASVLATDMIPCIYAYLFLLFFFVLLFYTVVRTDPSGRVSPSVP